MHGKCHRCELKNPGLLSLLLSQPKSVFYFLVGPLTLHHPDNRPVLPGVMAPLLSVVTTQA